MKGDDCSFQKLLQTSYLPHSLLSIYDVVKQHLPRRVDLQNFTLMQQTGDIVSSTGNFVYLFSALSWLPNVETKSHPSYFPWTVQDASIYHSGVHFKHRKMELIVFLRVYFWAVLMDWTEKEMVQTTVIWLTCNTGDLVEDVHIFLPKPTGSFEHLWICFRSY